MRSFKSVKKLTSLILAGGIAVLFINLSRTPGRHDHSITRMLSITGPPATKEESDDDPIARNKYEWMRLHDPVSGVIPSGIRRRELAYASQLRTIESQRAAKLGKTGSTTTSTWNQRGPYNVGGRTRALAYDVTSSTTILAGGVSGGMWRSTDGGSSWTKTSGSSDLLSVTCLAQDTRSGHQNTWYFGTGESSGNSASGGSASYRGDGVFKSTDDGTSWFQLSSTVSGTPQVFDSPFDYVHNMVVDPSDGEVYAAASNVIMKSTDGGTSWSTVRGLFANNSKTDVAVTTTGVVYAVLNSSVTNSGIWRSPDGTTWTNITPAGFPSVYGRIVIGIAPSNENVVYFLVQGTNGTNGSDQVNSHQFWKYFYLGGDGSGTNGTWVNRGVNLPNETGLSGNAKFDTQGGYDMLVRVKPDDSSFVIIGGTNLYRTTDAFATNSHWTRIGGYSGPSTYALYTNHHPDQHAGAFKPGSNTEYVSGDDGGIQSTIDIAASTVNWTPLNNGYFTTQFYAIALDHGTNGDNTIVGGMQDNGSWETTSNSSTVGWTNELSGDGTFCAIADGGGSIYVSSQNSEIYRLTNSGFVRIDPTGGIGYLFVNPFVLDPNSNSLIYLAGGNVLWRNSDISAIPVDLTQTTKSTNWASLSNASGAGGTISALGISRSPANVLYYGTSNGKVFRINGANSGNPVPTDVWSTAGFPSGAYVSCIGVDQQGGDSAVVVFSNYSVVSLFWTTDGGSSWADIAGNLEQNTDGSGNGPSCRWATIVHGSASTHYFVGTSTGIYSTTTLNGTSTVWSQEGTTEIGDVVTDMIDARASDGTVIAGTHGNGVFSTTIADPLPVEIASISGTVQGAKALLTWSTATEVNNSGWEVERKEIADLRLTSADWMKIGFVTGSGTSTGPKQYSFVDQNLSAGLYSYRLKQLDRNGTFKYSQEVQVEVGAAAKTFSLSQNYPNPFNPSTTIQFTIPADGRVVLKVFDLLGREVATLLDEDRKAGVYQQAEFNASNFASGVYFSRLEFGGIQQMKKMILLK
jgi:photosystem II stability/assembly factor-like uncharacterized protein